MHIIHFILKILYLIFKNNRYILPEDYFHNKEIQLDKIRYLKEKYSNTYIDGCSIIIKYTFCSDQEFKIESMFEYLQDLSYEIDLYTDIVDNQLMWQIEGETVKFDIDIKNLIKWTNKMCFIAFRFDCDFDIVGWIDLSKFRNQEFKFL